MSDAARSPALRLRPPPKAAPAPDAPVATAPRGPVTLGAGQVPVQFQLSDPDAPVQLDCGCGGTCACGGPDASDAGEDAPGPGGFQLGATGTSAPPKSAHSIARAGVSGASDPLPFGDRIQAAFGHHDVSGVRTRTGGRAEAASRALGANGYARQNNVAFRATPDLHLAAHEAAHTVQQKRGVRLKGGVGQKGDPYEQQADAAADAVVAGESAEALLDRDPGGGSAATGPGVQKDCDCGGSCPACQAGQEDALQMALSVTPLPSAEAEAAPAPETDEEHPTDAVSEAAAEDAPASEAVDAAEEDTETEGEPTKPAASAAGTSDAAAPPSQDTEAHAQQGGDEATAATTAAPQTDEEPDAEDAPLQLEDCTTTEPSDVEEPSEPPPGEVQENAEASGPAPADEGEDPGALQSALTETGTSDGAAEAAGTIEAADPAAAEAAAAQQEGGASDTGTAQPDPAVAAGADLSDPMAQVAATRAASVAQFATAQTGLGDARNGAPALAGMNTTFNGDGAAGRQDLQAASAQLQGMLGRASSSIVAESIAIEAAILSQTETALTVAVGTVHASTAMAQIAVTQSVLQAKARVMSDANLQRGIVDTQAEIATAAVDAQMAAALARVTSAKAGAIAGIGVAQAAQTGPLIAAHATGQQQVRDAGTEIGQEAMDIAGRYKSAYEQDRKVSGGECIEDSWYDGCLCDRRARARMTAAQQVGEGYRDSLVQASNEQADGMREGLATDLSNLAAMADTARTTATTQAAATSSGITSRSLAAKAAINAARSSTNTQITATEATTLANLDALLAAQMRSLSELGFVQVATLEETAHKAAAAALEAVTTAIQSATSGVAMAVAGLTAGPPPPEEALADALAQAETMLDVALAGLSAANQAALAAAVARIYEGMAAAQAALLEAQTSGTDQAVQMAETAATSMAAAAAMTTASVMEAMTDFFVDADIMAGGAETAMQAIVTGLTASYVTFIGNLATSFTNSAENLKTGLREALDGMHSGENAIPTKAREAAAKEKPAWQSVLKWVLIIAIVIAVAVVAGPAVIGAIGGIAAGMGASAGVAGFIGATVGGALLGAATGATMQVVNNVFDGNPWHQGVGKAIVTGLVTGALGGAIGFGIGAAFQGAAQGAQVATRSLGSRALEFGANLTADAGMEIGQQLIETGTVDWGNFGVAMAMSVGTAGLGEIPRVKAIQGAISDGVGNSVTNAVRSARGTTPDVTVRPSVDLDTNIAPRIEADAQANPRAAADDGGAPRAADAGPTRAAEPDAPARAADADDAANPRVGDDGSVRDSDLSATAARSAAEPDAPRLDADPDTPARQRTDSELAEAAQPVRMDGEDHALVPRRWIDGEIRLFMCSDCGPILNRLTEVSNRTSDPELRARLDQVRADTEALEMRIKNGESSAEMQAEMQRIRDSLDDVEWDIDIANAFDAPVSAGALLSDLAVHRQAGQMRRDMRADPNMRSLRGRPGSMPAGATVNPNPGYQSAHIIPQSSVRGVSGINPRDMITRMLPTGRGHAHTTFDQHWQATFRRMRQANPGQTTVTAREVFDVVDDAIRNSGAFSPQEAASTSAMLYEQMFITEGLSPGDLLRMPGS